MGGGRSPVVPDSNISQARRETYRNMRAGAYRLCMTGGAARRGSLLPPIKMYARFSHKISELPVLKKYRQTAVLTAAGRRCAWDALTGLSYCRPLSYRVRLLNIALADYMQGA